MKSFKKNVRSTSVLFVVMALLFTKTCFATIIFVDATHTTTDVQLGAVGSTSFNVEFNITSGSYNNEEFTIDLPDQITMADDAFHIVGSAIGVSAEFELVSFDLNTNEFTIKYIGTTIWDDVSPVRSLDYEVVSDCGTSAASGLSVNSTINTTATFNSSSGNFSVLNNASLPVLAYQSAGDNHNFTSTAVPESFNRTYYLRNNVDDFTGVIEFEADVKDPGLDITNITMDIVSGTDPNDVGFTVISSGPTMTFTDDVTSPRARAYFSSLQGQYIRITEEVTANACLLSSGNQHSGLTDFTIRWGASPSFCNTIGGVTTVQRNGTANLTQTVTHNLVGTGCSRAGASYDVEYVITNTGTIAANDINFLIGTNLGNTLIDAASLSVTFNGSTEVLTLPSGNATLLNNAFNNLSDATLNSHSTVGFNDCPQFNGGGNFEFTFNYLYYHDADNDLVSCSESESRTISTDPSNPLETDPFGRWGQKPTCLDDKWILGHFVINRFGGSASPINLAPGESLTISYTETLCCLDEDYFGPDLKWSKAAGRLKYINDGCNNEVETSIVRDDNRNINIDKNTYAEYGSTPQIMPFQMRMRGNGGIEDVPSRSTFPFYVFGESQAITMRNLGDFNLSEPRDWDPTGSFVEFEILFQDGLTLDQNLEEPSGAYDVGDVIVTLLGNNFTLTQNDPFITITATQNAGDFRYDIGGTPPNFANATNQGRVDTWRIRFNVGAYISANRDPAVTPSVQLRDILDNSSLSFDVKAFCTSISPTHFAIRTYWAPCGNNSCRIPISELQNIIRVNCPGCDIPGLTALSPSIERTLPFLGDPDDNDNGIHEATETDINVINRQLATLNDEMESVIRIGFPDGTVDLSDPYSYTDSDLRAGGVHIDFVQLSIEPPPGLEVVGCSLTYVNPGLGNGVNQSIDLFDLATNAGNTNYNSDHIQADGLLGVQPFETYQSSPDPNNIASIEEYVLMVHADDFSDIPDAAQMPLKRFPRDGVGQLYVSVIYKITEPLLPDGAQADLFSIRYTPFASHKPLFNWLDPGGRTLTEVTSDITNNDMNYGFHCEANEVNFMYVPLTLETQIEGNAKNAFGGDFKGNAHPGCTQNFKVSASLNYNVDGQILNAFPNEVRSFAHPEQIEFDIPTGYLIDKVALKNKSFFQNATQELNVEDMQVDVSQTGTTITISLADQPTTLSFPPNPVTSFDVDNISATNPYPFYLSDDGYDLQLSVLLTPDNCAQDPNNWSLTECANASAQRVKPPSILFSNDPAPVQTMRLMNGICAGNMNDVVDADFQEIVDNGNPVIPGDASYIYEYENPRAAITLAQGNGNNPLYTSNSSFAGEFRLSNTAGPDLMDLPFVFLNFASNGFAVTDIEISLDGGMSWLNAASDGEDDGIFMLENIVNAEYDELIKFRGDYVCAPSICDVAGVAGVAGDEDVSQPCTTSIAITANWHCTNNATVAQSCGAANTHTFKVISEPVQLALSSTVGSAQACNIFNYHLEITSGEQGYLNSFDISLPQNYTIDASSITVSGVGVTGFTTSDTDNDPLTSNIQIVEDPQHSGIHNDESITVSFQFQPPCDIPTGNQNLNVTVDAQTYCGSMVSDDVTDNILIEEVGSNTYDLGTLDLQVCRKDGDDGTISVEVIGASVSDFPAGTFRFIGVNMAGVEYPTAFKYYSVTTSAGGVIISASTTNGTPFVEIIFEADNLPNSCGCGSRYSILTDCCTDCDRTVTSCTERLIDAFNELLGVRSGTITNSNHCVDTDGYLELGSVGTHAQGVGGHIKSVPFSLDCNYYEGNASFDHIMNHGEPQSGDYCTGYTDDQDDPSFAVHVRYSAPASNAYLFGLKWYSHDTINLQPLFYDEQGGYLSKPNFIAQAGDPVNHNYNLSLRVPPSGVDFNSWYCDVRVNPQADKDAIYLDDIASLGTPYFDADKCDGSKCIGVDQDYQPNYVAVPVTLASTGQEVIAYLVSYKQSHVIFKFKESNCKCTLRVKLASQITNKGCSVDLKPMINGGSGSYTYNWTSDDPQHSTVSHTGGVATVSAPSLGTYTYTLVVTDNDTQCEEQASIQVVSTLAINDPAPVCFPQTVDLTAPEVTEGTPTCFNLSYWLDANAQNAITDPTAVSAGTYYIKAADAYGNSTVIPVNVTVNGLPTVDAGTDSYVCDDGTTTLSGSSPASSVSWSPTTGLSNPSILTPTLDGSQLSANITYTLSVTDANGCSNSDDVLITVTDCGSGGGGGSGRPAVTDIATRSNASGITIIATPNPFTGKIELKFHDSQSLNLDVEIMNKQGQLVYSVTGHAADQTLKIENDWESGLYLIKVRDGERMVTEKIIKL